MQPSEPGDESLDRVERVSIFYVNYKGERDTRLINPISLYFGSTDYHPEKQWILHAWDYDRRDFREFAMKDIKQWMVVAELP
jgi:predicted DNA-binding transcriptional regulator YafY